MIAVRKKALSCKGDELKLYDKRTCYMFKKELVSMEYINYNESLKTTSVELLTTTAQSTDKKLFRRVKSFKRKTYR